MADELSEANKKKEQQHSSDKPIRSQKRDIQEVNQQQTEGKLSYSKILRV